MSRKASFIAIAVVALGAAEVGGEERYTVSKGDSLSKIARQFGVTYEEIMTANDLKHTHIYEGQVLTIPGVDPSQASSDSGPIRIKKRPEGALDRYRAPGLSDSPEERDGTPIAESANPRVGLPSGEMPIQPLPGGDQPAVYVKPKARSHTYPPASTERYESLPVTDVAGVSPYNDGKKTSGIPIPDIIKPVKTVPLGSQEGTYVVQRGDSVKSISKDFGVHFWELRKLNNIEFKRIYPGQVLKIPGRTGRANKSVSIRKKR